MTTIIGKRLQQFNTPGSMGVVKDTTFIRCFWPVFDEPTSIFAEGSSGIKVMGPPTPRNIIFPQDTVFLSYHPDAVLEAEKAVQMVSEKERFAGELTDKETLVYLSKYNETKDQLPQIATSFVTKPVYFRKTKDNITPLTEKEALTVGTK